MIARVKTGLSFTACVPKELILVNELIEVAQQLAAKIGYTAMLTGCIEDGFTCAELTY